MPFLGGLMNKMLGMQPGQGFGDRLQAGAAFGQGMMGQRGLLGALGGGIQGAHQWQQANPWGPPKAPNIAPGMMNPNIAPIPIPGMQPGGFGSVPGGITQMPMPGMQPGGFGALPNVAPPVLGGAGGAMSGGMTAVPLPGMQPGGFGTMPQPNIGPGMPGQGPQPWQGQRMNLGFPKAWGQGY